MSENQQKEQDINNTELKGLELLVDKNLQSYIRLPILEIIYDRFVRINSNSLRNYTAENVDVDIININTRRFGEYMESIPSPSMIVVFKVLEWDNFGMIVVNSEMIYSLVELLLGGRKSAPSLRVEGRLFTSIESNMVKTVSEIILDDLSKAFENVTAATFQLDRLETNPKFAMIVRPEDAAITVNLKISMESRQGAIDIILPYSTIDPVKNILSKSYIGERGSRDPSWLRHFESEINKAKVKIQIVINSIATNIETVAGLKVGKTVILDKEPDDDWDVKVSNVKITTAKTGKVGDKLAVKLNDNINTSRYKV